MCAGYVVEMDWLDRYQERQTFFQNECMMLIESPMSLQTKLVDDDDNDDGIDGDGGNDGNDDNGNDDIDDDGHIGHI